MIYDPASHTYLDGNRIIPNVTAVISQVQNTAWFTEESAERGRFFHECCRLAFLGTLDYDWLLCVYPAMHADVMAYCDYLSRRGLWDQKALIEQPLYSQEFEFCGSPDYIFPGLIIDLKNYPYSSACHKVNAYQLYGYHHLALANPEICGPGPFEIENVYIAKGKYQEKSHPVGEVCLYQIRAWNEFEHMLKVYKLGQEHGKYQKYRKEDENEDIK